MFELTTGLIAGGALAVLGTLATLITLTLRRVVPTNEVHIVQSGKRTVSYGASTGNGNTYYEWPSALPLIGVVKSAFKTSIFPINLNDFDAYDSGRLPLVVDVMAFFRIKDSNAAAEKVSSFAELNAQLLGVVQGAVRSILAKSDIEEIMQDRSRFGDEFTKEVNQELANWGVEAVKNLELMDIRDGKGSEVIHNIMAKKKSLIEKESRTVVANNQKSAQMAEIEAKKEVDLTTANAKQEVGLRTTQSDRQVALAEQEKIQALKEQEKVTREKEMAVKKIVETKTAEIAKDVALVKSEQDKQQQLIAAEAERQKTVLTSSGQLEATKNRAEGIAAEGKAKADAERAMLLAPVEAQTTLAKEIGGNDGYQKYLITIEQVKANAEVGKAQAAALEKAQIKVIANSGSVGSSIQSMGDLFSSKGGTDIGAMLEGFANTDVGQSLLQKLIGGLESKETTSSNALAGSTGSARLTTDGISQTSTNGSGKKSTSLNGKA